MKTIAYIFLLILAVQSKGVAQNFINEVYEMRDWKVNNYPTTGTFSMYKDGHVFIHTPANENLVCNFSDLSQKDQLYVVVRQQRIDYVNSFATEQLAEESDVTGKLSFEVVLFTLLCMIFTGVAVYRVTSVRRVRAGIS
jgi:hypothetical protein